MLKLTLVAKYAPQPNIVEDDITWRFTGSPSSAVPRSTRAAFCSTAPRRSLVATGVDPLCMCNNCRAQNFREGVHATHANGPSTFGATVDSVHACVLIRRRGYVRLASLAS